MKFFTVLLPLMVIGLVLVHVSLCGVISRAKKKKGTAVCLRNVMEERCDMFNEKTNGKWDCPEITSTFFNAFAYNGPCALSENAYSSYLKATYQPTPLDKTMLWSGGVVKWRAMKFSSDCNFVTLSHTLTGCQPGEVRFCGQEVEPGVNYFECDNCNNSGKSSHDIFWRAASIDIAERAQGVVSVMLSAKRKDGAYKPTSMFAKYELAYLNTKSVTEVKILLVDKSDTENCDSGTLLKLKDHIRDLGFKATCISDPTAIEKVCNDSKVTGSTADFYLCAGGEIDKPTTQAVVVFLFLSVILNTVA